MQDKLGPTPSRSLLIEGNIVNGDAIQVLVAIVEGIEDGPVLSVEIASRGGSLIEGLKLSALLNSALINVIPAELSDLGNCISDDVEGTESCYCQSTCTFIWMAASRRAWSDKLGVHRPYMTKEMFSTRTLEQAEDEYDEMISWLREYLTAQDVPVQALDVALQYGSNEMRILSREEVVDFPTVKPVLYEYLDAKCAGKAGRQERVAYDAEMKKAYAQNDVAALLVLGLGSRSDVLQMDYSNCLSSEIYRLALERQKSPFGLINKQCELLPKSASWFNDECSPAKKP
jgi:hypothetical protein